MLWPFRECSKYLKYSGFKSYESKSPHLPNKPHEKSNNKTGTPCCYIKFCRLSYKELIGLPIWIIPKCESARKISIPEVFHHSWSIKPPDRKYPDKLISFRNKFLHSFGWFIFSYMASVHKGCVVLKILCIIQIENYSSITRFFCFRLIDISDPMSKSISTGMSLDDKWMHGLLRVVRF